MIKFSFLLCLMGAISAYAKSDFNLVKTLNIGSSVNKSAQSETLNYSLETSEEVSTANLLKFISRQTAKHNVSDSQSLPQKQKIKARKFRFWGEVFNNKSGQHFAIFMLAPQDRAKKVAVGSTSTRLNISPAPLDNDRNHSFKLPWGKYLILRKLYTFNNEFLGKKNGVLFQNKDQPFLVGALIRVKDMGTNADNFGNQFFKYLNSRKEN